MQTKLVAIVGFKAVVVESSQHIARLQKPTPKHEIQAHKHAIMLIH